MSIRDIAEPVSLNDGTAMPGYGFGCYAAHGEEIINAIRWAVRDGYRYIDSAAMYGNEAEVGEAIRTCGVQREDLFISSKIWPTRFDDPDASLAQSFAGSGNRRFGLLPSPTGRGRIGNNVSAHTKNF